MNRSTTVRLVRRFVLPWTLSGLAFAASAGGASACPCSEFCGPVIDHGSTPHGVPWRITAFERQAIGPQARAAEFHFSTGACDEYKESGYFVGFSLPVSPRFAFSATSGSDLDEFPESDLSGLTTSRARTLILGFTDGSTLLVHPQLAPPDLRRRWPWLKRLRVFDLYFATGPRPASLAACDGRGHLIANQTASRYFSFEAAVAAGTAGTNHVCRAAEGKT
jgi:hypothetical protein